LQRKIFKNPTKHQTLVTVNCESHYNEALINQQQPPQQQQQHRPNDINKNYKSNLSEQESIIPEDGRINYSNNRAQVHHGSRHVVNMLGNFVASSIYGAMMTTMVGKVWEI
jgi:hypothetical protein